MQSLLLLRLRGKQAQTFLQGQLTCDVLQLKKTGDYALTACCDRRGRMLATFWLLRQEEDYLLILPDTIRPLLHKHLKKYAMLSRVLLTEEDTLFVSAQRNPNSNNQLSITLPDGKRQLHLSEHQTSTSFNATAWRLENIKNKLAILQPATSLLFTPQMIQLEKLGGVSFSKGCYVGQEIVARTEHLGTLKRHLQHVTLSQAQAAGDTLRNTAGEAIGIIVDAVDQTALAVVEDRFQLAT